MEDIAAELVAARLLVDKAFTATTELPPDDVDLEPVDGGPVGGEERWHSPVMFSGRRTAHSASPACSSYSVNRNRTGLTVRLNCSLDSNREK